MPCRIGSGCRPHEGPEGRVQHGTFQAGAADGIGAVQDHDLLARLARRLQDQGQGVDERIVTGAHVLQVEHQDVGFRQHGPGGPPCLPVQAVKRQLRVRIPVTLPLHHVVLGLAVNAVLRAHDRNQVDPGMLPEEVDDVAEAGVHRGGVGDDGDPLSGRQVQPSVQEEVKTRSNLHQPLLTPPGASPAGDSIPVPAPPESGPFPGPGPERWPGRDGSCRPGRS